ncbi:hypothetical protein [Flavobacterium silvaticum]|uniref:Uncharacterized protein n=1 Tax=Flavobacterium silvaticum TaxID=1852020 RepID=A0A972FMK5_9FLAO|nr:hypothetical protein [Flavobacterium silvaticum]NMH28488.1 hypothetical protein [Flavobacterium silvaticum]
MQNHIDQASHNQNFHSCIQGQFATNFFDWKITVLFYIALHGLKALASKRGIDIGETHIDIERNVSPLRNSPIMAISKNAWNEYKSLFRYSQVARYEGITDFETFQKLKESDHGFCVLHLDKFKKYLKGQGVDLDLIPVIEQSPEQPD